MSSSCVVVGEAEIRDLDVHAWVKEQVFSLEIAMDYPMLVTVIHRVDNLPKFPAGKRFWHPAVAGDVFWKKHIQRDER